MNEYIILVFIIGYTAIIFEHLIRVNKAATALLTGVGSWILYIASFDDKGLVLEQLYAHVGEISGLLFFLLGAMTIVELIEAHSGLDIITEKINQKSKRALLWIITIITFFLSAVLDNLTTTILMISLVRKLIEDNNDKLFFASAIVIAANAGGVWSPIGDVTTTMLWIGGQINAEQTITKLFLPSFSCFLFALIFITFKINGVINNPQTNESYNNQILSKTQRCIVLISGIFALISVPVFKMLTHLPPFMGILFGLGIVWFITEMIHLKTDKEFKISYSVESALKRIDSATILFFLGILLCISSLQSIGILSNLAVWMSEKIANDTIILLTIGLVSAITDNVPLVAAVQKMFSLSQYPSGNYFWEFLAYTSGTGGSSLIIGSAAGVAAMALEKINFFWYLKKISIIAITSFFFGAFVYILQNYIINT